MSGAKEASGSLATALAHTRRLLATKPALAEQQAREILKVAPSHPEAMLLLGLALADQGQSRESIDALSRAVSLDKRLAPAWLALADQLTLAGESERADAAYAEHIKASVNNKELLEAAAALCENRLAIAERLLRAYLKQHPTDVPAIRMLAETGSRLARYDDAEKLLARCLELAPSFAAARHNYASVLHRLGRFKEALAECDVLLARDPRNPSYRSLKAALLGRVGDYDHAIALYDELLKTHPDQPKAWLSFGHALRAVGRQAEGIAAYRKSVALMPSFGEAYWSLANLKTFRFAPDEIEKMKQELTRTNLGAENRLHLHFALGKALEDEGDYAAAFEHYSKGNEVRHSVSRYDADETQAHAKRSKALFSKVFFEQRVGWGHGARDPIFIVGLPRSGSTLVEQILSSHSMIEGTMELSDIISMSQRLGGRHKRGEPSRYPEYLAELTAEELEALGREYLERTRIQRRLGRPFFIDKMPNNFAHLGFVHLILPNAKIVDARRHPLACCVSGFKQHFARGQNFTYDLADIGRYYHDYVELMAHFDSVLPARVHRVIHERLVDAPEEEIRRLLDYCGLPFEDACLRFYETERPVRTASSEQVRLPLSKEGLDRWQNFERWLDPLKDALGEVLTRYPDVPQFDNTD